MNRIIYSLVIDAGAKFQDQARIFLATLMAAGVGPERIHAHFTPAACADAGFLDGVRAIGVHCHRLTPFLDGTYCNKLVQLDALPMDAADFVVLCDTDLAFLTSLDDVVRAGTVRAKPVDLPNPPLAYLEAARELCGIAGEPRLVTTSCDPAQTWSVNCNGGVYILPCPLAAAVGERWKRHATKLHAASAFLEGYAHHIDQISFAMAMLDLGLDVEELPIECNFPAHQAERLPLAGVPQPRVLHYHWLHDGARALQETGHPVIDGAVQRVNALLATSAVTA